MRKSLKLKWQRIFFGQIDSLLPEAIVKTECTNSSENVLNSCIGRTEKWKQGEGAWNYVAQKKTDGDEGPMIYILLEYKMQS